MTKKKILEFQIFWANYSLLGFFHAISTAQIRRNVSRSTYFVITMWKSCFLRDKKSKTKKWPIILFSWRGSHICNLKKIFGHRPFWNLMDFGLFSGFRRFSKIATKPGHIFEKITWGRGDQKMSTFHDSQNQKPKFVYNMYKISSPFDTGRHSDWISLKLGRAVVCIENMCCIVFGSIRPTEGGVRGHANSRIFRKLKPDYRFFWNSIGW